MLKFKRKLVLCDKDDITITVRMFGVVINVLWVTCSSFSQTHKVDNTGFNANFKVFFFYLHELLSVNVKLDINGGLLFKFADISGLVHL